MSRFEEAFSHLTQLTNWEKKKPGSRHRIDLSGTTDLLARLGDPQRRLGLVAQVAGSKGKGTTVCLLAGMARAAGMSTGTYMSPHVLDPRERIQVDGRPVDVAVFERAVERVRDALIPEQTWYEAYTAVAICCFAELELDLCVLEVGLGGRLDATTVVPKDVCAITGIELEHTHVLGDTIEAIAGEKAGILRRDVPCVSACRGVASDVVEARAREVGSPLRLSGRDFELVDARRAHGGFDVELAGFEGLRRAALPLRARTQLGSFAVALAMLEVLREGTAAKLFADRERTELSWLAEALPPGRFEVVREEPPIVVDGAHTDASLAAFAEDLAAGWPDRRFALVFGIAQGKRFREGLGRLLELVDRAYVVPLDGKASVAASELETIFDAHRVRSRSFSSMNSALEAVQAEHDDAICVTGSLYAAGDALRVLGKRLDD